jgi:hypothetical protein
MIKEKVGIVQVLGNSVHAEFAVVHDDARIEARHLDRYMIRTFI